MGCERDERGNEPCPKEEKSSVCWAFGHHCTQKKREEESYYIVAERRRRIKKRGKRVCFTVLGKRRALKPYELL